MDKHVLMFDPDQMAVGCVIIQAAFGCESGLVNKFGFHTNTWLLAPTPGLKRLAATKEQWQHVAIVANEKWKSKRAS